METQYEKADIIIAINTFNYLSQKVEDRKGLELGLATDGRIVVLSYTTIDQSKIDKETNEDAKEQLIARAFSNVMNKARMNPYLKFQAYANKLKPEYNIVLEEIQTKITI
ncbi:hypothetical protein [Vibrio harveyi]|uniref:hypothetical protein n=1 Tax=Vibrio harveyi TaxID=669 RepID=UPI0023800094|nr:hypothetical protein [Vibrio harveyi]